MYKDIVMSFFDLYKPSVLVSFFIHSSGMLSWSARLGPAAAQTIQEVCGNTGDAGVPRIPCYRLASNPTATRHLLNHLGVSRAEQSAPVCHSSRMYKKGHLLYRLKKYNVMTI